MISGCTSDPGGNDHEPDAQGGIDAARDPGDIADALDAGDPDASDVVESRFGDVVDASDASDVSDVDDAGDVGDTGDASDVGDVNDAGDVGDVNDAGDVGDTGHFDDTGDDPVDVDAQDAGNGGHSGDANLDAGDSSDEPDASDAADVSDSVAIGPWPCAPDLPLDSQGYEGLEGLENEDLLDALYPLVADHISYSYKDARNYMFGELEPQEDGKIECVYTARRVFPDGTTTPGGFNTEHSWPQSQGASKEPARSDLHHIFPSDASANSERANYEFGNVDCDPAGCPWGESGSYVGGSEDDDRDPVFEVRPERRGDIARAIFYFAVRYNHVVTDEQEAVLRQWHCEDAPDEFERIRNDGIEALQENRNPFVDRPDLVDRIVDF